MIAEVALQKRIMRVSPIKNARQIYLLDEKRTTDEMVYATTFSTRSIHPGTMKKQRIKYQDAARLGADGKLMLAGETRRWKFFDSMRAREHNRSTGLQREVVDAEQSVEREAF